MSKATDEAADRKKRMRWWHDAKFGMFVHWGLYSVLGRHEWAMNRERIPVEQYEKLADRFEPKPNAMRNWARLAKQAGAGYLVLTTKHHEGYCLWNTEQTDFNAVKRGPGRDLIADYVRACREYGLKVGFYYSLMDWHHPDGARSLTNKRAHDRFIRFTHHCVEELMTKFGKVDILWYDVPWPGPDAKWWQSDKLNARVRELQPGILINNRSRTPEDFGTPEQHITPEEGDRAWEACMTTNESWGFNAGDQMWKTPEKVVDMLRQCSAGGGNLLLNVGPTADGTIPRTAQRIFKEVGRWLGDNGEAFFGTHRLAPGQLESIFSVNGQWTVKGRTAYLYCFAWPGESFAIGGFKAKVKDIRILGTTHTVRFEQTKDRVILHGLPINGPDRLCTVLAIECAGKPRNELGPGMIVPKKKS